MGVVILFEIIILALAPHLAKAEFNQMMPLISSKKQEQIRKYHSHIDSQNSLLGDILIRAEICRITGLCNKQLEFSTNEYGKPCLINDRGIHFNITHTNNFVACAIGDEPVGIDIEQIKPITLKIAERFFAENETLYIISREDGLIYHRFFEIWTKKESYIKWIGKGLSIPLSSFSVFDVANEGEVNFRQVFNDDRFVCHTCSTNMEFPRVKKMSTTDFFEYLNAIGMLEKQLLS
jgi:4'-phosphopantetheinyl transferase